MPVEPYGSFKVELLEEGGNPIDGYSSHESDIFEGDDLRQAVTWDGNPNVSKLTGKNVRLRFHLRNAALYDFQFVTDGTRQSPANLLVPGSKGMP